MIRCKKKNKTIDRIVFPYKFYVNGSYEWSDKVEGFFFRLFDNLDERYASWNDKEMMNQLSY